LTVFAYMRVSKDEQELINQRLSIQSYAKKNNFEVDHFISIKKSGLKSLKALKIELLLDAVQTGDLVIVAELSRLGRTLGKIMQVVDTLIDKKVSLVTIKENIELLGSAKKQNIQTKVMITMFGLFAEIERDLISERVKDGLIAAVAKGKRLGRPKGSLSQSKLDDQREQLQEYLEKGLSKTAMSKLLDVSRSTLTNYLKTRNLEEMEEVELKEVDLEEEPEDTSTTQG